MSNGAHCVQYDDRFIFAGTDMGLQIFEYHNVSDFLRAACTGLLCACVRACVPGCLCACLDACTGLLCVFMCACARLRE